jgi:hypothetical protein
MLENYPIEEWRPVVGYERWYSVSRCGRVRREAAYNSTRKGFILRGHTNTLGYVDVILSFDGKRKHRFLHQIVASAFIGPCPANLEINHRNGDKSDNDAEPITREPRTVCCRALTRWWSMVKART